MNLLKVLLSPVVIAAAVVEDAVFLVPSKMSDPGHESAVFRAAKFLAAKEN